MTNENQKMIEEKENHSKALQMRAMELDARSNDLDCRLAKLENCAMELKCRLRELECRSRALEMEIQRTKEIKASVLHEQSVIKHSLEQMN